MPLPARPFEGNPAAVCPLAAWLPDELMQSIAQENNLSETAFFVMENGTPSIRWFTPTAEVRLCGHATLASAYVLFHIPGFPGDRIDFESKSGILSVWKKEGCLIMDFPAQPPEPCDTPQEIINAFDAAPAECFRGEDYVVIFEAAEAVYNADPNPEVLKRLDGRGCIISAPSKEYDFIARFFAPKYGVAEDPVTDSAYTQLVPYWAEHTNRKKFHVRQGSKIHGGDRGN